MTGADAPRIAPLPEDQWDDEVRAALRTGFLKDAADRSASASADGPRMPNAVTTLMRHPRLAGPFLAYNGVLLFAPTLEPRTRELMILRVAWRTRAAYEWLQHVRLAAGCGITPEEVAAVGDGATSDVWTPFESDLLAATDQLIDRYRIADETWTRLAEQLDERQLVELVFVVGTYTCLAMAFNSFGIELDPDLRAIVAPPLPAPEET